MIKFIKESREELRNVVWPSREEVLNSTIVVMVAVVMASLFLYGVDHLFEYVFNALVSLGS
ncbi:MAG: preprotein translocase subunit SecE [Leptospiraceae bacterium]|nr:preprotein translocase subunit SecE [Leptospiraceae bacterium]